MDTVNGLTSGRFVVCTASGSAYDINLDDKTLSRRPKDSEEEADDAPDTETYSVAMRRDREEVTLLNIYDCTVGVQARFVVDLNVPGVFFTTRETTTVVSIEAVAE